MAAFVPTLIARDAAGSRLHLTPPPEDILSPEVCQQVQQKVQLIADHLALRGLMQVDGFVHVGTGVAAAAAVVGQAQGLQSASTLQAW
jgi:hypothetical protein